MIHAPCNGSGSQIQELLDFRISAASELHDQFFWKVPPPVGERDPDENGCIDLPGVVDGQRELAGSFSAAQGE